MTDARATSWWGWGWADRWPDADARQNLVAMLEGLHGLRGRPAEPPDMNSLLLPPCRVDVPAALQNWVSTAHEARVRNTWGRGFMDILRGFQGDFSVAPDAVARPRSAEDVRELLKWAQSVGAVVIPRGGGTTVVGGVTLPARSERPVVVLDMTGMTAVTHVDPVSRLARIEAGATGPQVQAQLAAHGFSLRHYPQSWEHSTVGGWVVTRAGGHYATGRTHFEDLVAGVEMVSPAGEYQTRVLPGSGAGPCPVRLVAGSEGTLGVVTAAHVRVQTTPAYRSQASVFFTDFDSACAVARQIAQLGLWPTNLRLLDANEAALNQVADGSQQVLLLAFEDDVATAERLELALNIALQAGGTCPAGPRHRTQAPGSTSSDASVIWKNAFFDGPYLQSLLLSFGLVADTFETACTWSAFPALHAALRAATQPIFDAAGGGKLSCRFTHVYPDGPAPYYTFLCQSEPATQEAIWRSIKTAVSDVLSAHGATITHHHAVGRLHRPWYEIERPALLGPGWNAMRRVFDPAGILNPGVLTDDEE